MCIRDRFLHREVVLRHHDHFGTHLLGFPGCPQLHGTPALTLTGGFFLALAHRRHRLGCGALLRLGLGGTSQARRENHVLLFACEAAGLCRQRIIVFTDDVHLLALLLWRAAAQSIEPGAVIPVGTARPPLPSGATRTEARTAGCRGGIRTRHGRGGCSCTCTGFGGCIRTAGCRCRWPADRLLQLHELTGSHRFAHSSGHAGTSRRSRTGGRTRATATCAAAVATNRLADQFQGVAAAGGHPGATLSGGCARTAWTSLALGHAGASRTAGHRFAHQFRPRRGP